MIGESIFASEYTTTLKRALAAYALRHRVVADNIANVETRGYRSQRVAFEELMSRTGSSLRVAGGHPGHLPVGGGVRIPTPEVLPADAAHDNGINNVDIDEQMGQLTKNDLAYRLATRLLSRTYQGLRSAITGEHR